MNTNKQPQRVPRPQTLSNTTINLFKWQQLLWAGTPVLWVSGHGTRPVLHQREMLQATSDSIQHCIADAGTVITGLVRACVAEGWQQE